MKSTLVKYCIFISVHFIVAHYFAVAITNDSTKAHLVPIFTMEVVLLLLDVLGIFVIRLANEKFLYYIVYSLLVVITGRLILRVCISLFDLELVDRFQLQFSFLLNGSVRFIGYHYLAGEIIAFFLVVFTDLFAKPVLKSVEKATWYHNLKEMNK